MLVCKRKREREKELQMFSKELFYYIILFTHRTSQIISSLKLHKLRHIAEYSFIFFISVFIFDANIDRFVARRKYQFRSWLKSSVFGSFVSNCADIAQQQLSEFVYLMWDTWKILMHSIFNSKQRISRCSTSGYFIELNQVWIGNVKLTHQL